MAKKQKAKKPFYKRVWFWILVVVVLGVAFSAMGGSGSNSSSSGKTTSSKAVKGSSTKTADKTNNTASKKIDFDNGSRTILAEATYPVKFTDSSWAGTTVNIDKARIMQVKPFKDDGDGKKYNDIVIVHFTVKATRDIDFYPTQGTLITSDGQQSDADGFDSGSWDGEIGEGVTKQGNVAFELPNAVNPKTIKTLRLKWDADYNSDDMNDTNSSKTYDITINL